MEEGQRERYDKRVSTGRTLEVLRTELEGRERSDRSRGVTESDNRSLPAIDSESVSTL